MKEQYEVTKHSLRIKKRRVALHTAKILFKQAIPSCPHYTEPHKADTRINLNSIKNLLTTQTTRDELVYPHPPAPAFLKNSAAQCCINLCSTSWNFSIQITLETQTPLVLQRKVGNPSLAVLEDPPKTPRKAEQIEWQEEGGVTQLYHFHFL